MIIERQKDEKIIFLLNKDSDYKQFHVLNRFIQDYRTKSDQKKVCVTVSINKNEILGVEDGAGRFL
jgi:hypothetical protein